LLIHKGLYFIFRLIASRFGEGYVNVTETSGPIIKGNRCKKFMVVNIIDFIISKYTAHTEKYNTCGQKI